MHISYHAIYTPGHLEVYCGPMKSGKSRELIHRLEHLKYTRNINFELFKPCLDNRFSETKIVTRKNNEGLDSVVVKNPYEIIEHIDLLESNGNNISIVGIDETQFFNKEIVYVIKKLLLKDKNILVAGLDLDFRGETFGPMGDILAIANEVTKLYAVCEFEGCDNLASRTQRLIDGEPAHYNSPIIMVGDEQYQPRCIKHHVVPRD